MSDLHNIGNPRPCRACGMKIVLLPGPNGNLIPLQRVTKVYACVSDEVTVIAQPEEEGERLFVNHWETCPKADQIKKQQAAQRNPVKGRASK